MPIGPKILRRYGKKYIVVMQSHTLGDAIDKLEKKGYEPNQSYLVVKGGDNQYQVILFADLERVIGLMGNDAFNIPLSHLPIPEAARIVPVDTLESSTDIVDWVALHPQSIVVIVDGQECAGLFANPNLSGIVEDRSLLGLHGELAKLYPDYRLGIKPNITPPRCPVCGRQNFFKFNSQKKIYVCPGCSAEVKQL